METIKNFERGVVSWETFEDLHTSTSILFDRLKYMVMVGIDGIETKEPVIADPMPFDIMESLIAHQEQELKDSWKSACAEKGTKEGQDVATLLKEYDNLCVEHGKTCEKVGWLKGKLRQYEGKDPERSDLKVVDGE